MFTHVLLMAAAVLVAGSLEGLEAQERSDFSGLWVVERVDSERPQGNLDGGRRGGGQGRGGIGGGGGRRGRGGGGIRGGGRDGGRDQSDRAGRGGQGGRAGFGTAYQVGDRVTLTQTDEALIVTDEARSLMSRYPFDGREVSNPGPADSTVKSETSWEGAALAIESTRSVAGPQGDLTLRTREVRSLSQDGRTMTLVATGTMPFGRMSSTVTFARTE